MFELSHSDDNYYRTNDAVYTDHGYWYNSAKGHDNDAVEPNQDLCNVGQPSA
jgi:hypothetical protein